METRLFSLNNRTSVELFDNQFLMLKGVEEYDIALNKVPIVMITMEGIRQYFVSALDFLKLAIPEIEFKYATIFIDRDNKSYFRAETKDDTLSAEQLSSLQSRFGNFTIESSQEVDEDYFTTGNMVYWLEVPMF